MRVRDRERFYGMGILFKYLTKNMMEKKFRTGLIILSVALSSALFFASVAISDTMSLMYERQIRQQTGAAELIIHPRNGSDQRGFVLRQEPVEGVALLAGEVSAGAVFPLSQAEQREHGIRNVSIHMRGFRLEDLQQMNPVQMLQVGTGVDFDGRSVIVSEPFAQRFGIAVGDRIELEVGGQTRRFMVWAVVAPTGLFRQHPQSETQTMVVPLETAGSLVGLRGRVGSVYVVPQPGADIDRVQETLSGVYNRQEVRRLFSLRELSEMLQMLVVPLLLMTTVVTFVSVFIIYSTFKVITMERLPVLGTFRSIGATRKRTDGLLLAESGFYGVAGGLLGMILGVGILYAITAVLARDPWSGTMDVAVRFSPGQLLMACVLAVGVALGSSMVPIIRVSRIPIRDLVLNTVEKTGRRKGWKTVVAILLLGFSLVGPRIAPRSVAMAVSMSALFASALALVFLTPMLTRLSLKVFGKVNGVLFGNEGLLAVKNLRDNKAIVDNVVLLAMGIAALLMINTISFSVGLEVLDAYADWNYDITLQMPAMDRQAEQSVRAVEGVTGTYGTYDTWAGVSLVDRDYRIGYLQGINTSTYTQYVRFRTEENLEDMWAKLNDGRTIMITHSMARLLEVERGDSLTLDMTAGPRTYRIIGLFDSIMANGSNAVISEANYKVDMKQPYFTNILVKTDNDPEVVLAALQDKFLRRGIFGRTLGQLKDINDQANSQMFVILNAFSLLAMLIGTFGVFNNYMISFIQRRRSLAIYRSVGLGQRQGMKMILIESLTGGLIGGLAGVLGGLLLLAGMPFMMRDMGLPIGIHYHAPFFLYAVAGGLVIATVASLKPASRAARSGIIEAIKYE